MRALLGCTIGELQEALQEMGEPAYRGKQVFQWLAQGVEFAQMTNLPAVLRTKLQETCIEGFLDMHSVKQGNDETKKYLFALSDGNTVESVYMPKNYGTTICISSQVGCAMGCAFCASCADGLTRNLTAGEMVAQVVAANTNNPERHVDHIVVMGMGEPLQNYDNLLRFLKIANDPMGLNIGRRSISVSTCGITNKMLELAEMNPGITLAVSLHAPTQEKRERIMPSAHKYPMGEIIDAAKMYFHKTGRRIIIEYALIEGLNDSSEDAKELAALLLGLNCHVNVIPLNAWNGYRAPSKKDAYIFCDRLAALGISATVRKSMGADIEGACGQLRSRTITRERE